MHSGHSVVLKTHIFFTLGLTVILVFIKLHCTFLFVFRLTKTVEYREEGCISVDQLHHLYSESCSKDSSVRLLCKDKFSNVITKVFQDVKRRRQYRNLNPMCNIQFRNQI